MFSFTNTFDLWTASLLGTYCMQNGLVNLVNLPIYLLNSIL